MKKLLVLFLALAFARPAAADPLKRIEGLGVDRSQLSPSLLQARLEAMRRTSEFSVLHFPDALGAPERIFAPEIWAIIEKEAAEFGIDPYLIAAVGMVESYGRSDVVSPTGPVGWSQISKSSAKAEGLKYKENKIKYQVEMKEWKGKGKKLHQVTKLVTKTRKEITDDRLDPAKAIHATAQRLARNYSLFGDWDLVLQEWHNGKPRVLKALSLYVGKEMTEKNIRELVKAKNLTYAQMYFDNTPYHNSKLYQYLLDIPDYGSTYSFRVNTARALLKEYEPNRYVALFKKYRSPFKEDGFSPSRMWYFYTPEQYESYKFMKLSDIVEGKNSGRLFDLPQPYAKYGIIPRLTGESPIAEVDLPNQAEYIRAEAPTVGCYMYVANELHLLQGEKFKPYETNSLVRNAVSQEDLGDRNPNARTSLQTHVIGKAFDIPVKGMSKERLRDLRYILWEMDSWGMISYVMEAKQKTIHVVPHPEWEGFFRDVLMDTTTTVTTQIADGAIE